MGLAWAGPGTCPVRLQGVLTEAGWGDVFVRSVRCKPARVSGTNGPLGRCWAVLTLSLARGRGLLGARVLDEHVVLVVGAALLAHLHHLHLGQGRVPLHHVPGPQGHQTADLQLAPAGTERTGPGEPAAPRPGPAQSAAAQHISSARHLTAQAPHLRPKPSRAGQGAISEAKAPGTRSPAPDPESRAPPSAPKSLPVVGRPEEKDKKEGKVVTVTEWLLQERRHWRWAGMGQVWAEGPHRGPSSWAGHQLPVPYSHDSPARKLTLLWTRTMTHRQVT